MKVLLLLSGLFLLTTAFASKESDGKLGYPTNIRTNGNEVTFELNCEPTKNSGLHKFEKKFDVARAEIKKSFSKVQCAIAQLKDPTVNCAESNPSLPPACGVQKFDYIIDNNTSYMNSMIPVLMGAYANQSAIRVRGQVDNRENTVHVLSISTH